MFTRTKFCLVLIGIYTFGIVTAQFQGPNIEKTHSSKSRIFANQQHLVIFTIVQKSILVEIYSCVDSNKLEKKYEFTLSRGMPVGSFILDSGSRLILLEDGDSESGYEIQILKIDYESKKNNEIFSVKSNEFGSGAFRKASDRFWYGGLYLINSYLGQLEINPPLKKETAPPMFQNFPHIILDYRNGKIIENNR